MQPGSSNRIRTWRQWLAAPVDASSLACLHAQTLEQARPTSLALWQGFGEHGSAAYEET